MEDRYKHLKDFQIEILDKFYTALDQIPLPVLEKFPQFNVNTYKNLKILHQHVKAKIRLVETKLTHIQTDEKQKLADEELSEVRNKCTNNSPLIKTPKTLNQQSIISISDSDDFSTSNSNLLDTESSYTMKAQTTTLSTVTEFSQLQTKIESQVKDQKKNIDLHGSEQTKSNDSPVQAKKGTFQLKRPVKATIGAEISKQIGEIWKKEENSKVTNTNKSAVSNLNTDISFDNIYDLEKVEINKSLYLEPKKKENFEISEKLKHENKQDDWNIDESYIEGKFYTFYMCVCVCIKYMIIYYRQYLIF